MDNKQKIWALAQEDVLRLLQVGLLSQANRLQDALNESKALGYITLDLLKIQVELLNSRAEELISRATQEPSSQKIITKKYFS